MADPDLRSQKVGCPLSMQTKCDAQFNFIWRSVGVLVRTAAPSNLHRVHRNPPQYHGVCCTIGRDLDSKLAA